MPMSMFDLTGHTALVTGGSRGLGAAMAVGLAQAGARIILVARDQVRLSAKMQEMQESGYDVSCNSVELSDGHAVEKLKEELTSAERLPSILVNSAGTIARGGIKEISDHQFNHVMDINVTSMLRLCRAFTPGMIEKGYGRIINISSIAALGGMMDRTTYCASKAAVIGFTQALATEMSNTGVTVNAICPGSFPTDFNRPLQESEAFQAWMNMKTPLKRWGQLDEMRGPVVFLASPASSYVTGQMLVVDGGTTATI